MLKNLTLVLAAAVTFSTLACPAVRAADMQSQLQAAYDGQCKSAVAKDAATFQTFFDPKFVGTDLDGKQVPLSVVVTEVTTPPAGLTVANCAFVIHKVSVANGVATALVTQTVTGTIVQGTGAPSPFVQFEESTDTWNVSGSPAQLTSLETGQRVTVDGKVVIDKGTVTAPAPAAQP
jgi:hypothetical protein